MSSEYGRWLTRVCGHIIPGNCRENASLALYYCQVDPSMAPKVQDLTLIKAGGEHAFVLISDQFEGAQGFDSIKELNSTRGEQAWVVDPWMWIACRAYQFEAELKNGRGNTTSWDWSWRG